MGIFGRVKARQRLRKATRESLTIPTFRSAVDCTPWVIAGLWPAELSTASAQTDALAEHLKTDLQRITSRANDELAIIRRAGMAYDTRQEHQARVIAEARARAVRRVESTLPHLHPLRAAVHAEYPHVQRAERVIGTDLDATNVIPAVTDEQPDADEHRRRHDASDTRLSGRGAHHR